MNEKEQQRINGVARDCRKHANILQIQVLNNIDALFERKDQVDLDLLDKLVKRSIMSAVTSMKCGAAELNKLASAGKLPC